MFEVLIGTILLLMVLALFTLFTYKAPYGFKAMGALASAACATFLVEAFHYSLFGEVGGIQLLSEIGSTSGSMGGLAAASLVMLALGVTPVYALMVGIVAAPFGILSGFIAGYLISFGVKYIEKVVPGGLDLIVIIIVVVPVMYLLTEMIDPIVNGMLMQIGEILLVASTGSPIIMGLILGGVITVVATAPLSSMALTSIIGLTGLPMVIGALSVFGSSFMNFVFFHKMKFGDRKDTISVAIEPLTQTDIISSNPIPVYTTNFMGGAASGIIVALVATYSAAGLDTGATGIATPIAGFFVVVGENGALGLMTALLCAFVSILFGFIGYAIFKNYKIMTASEIRNK